MDNQTCGQPSNRVWGHLHDCLDICWPSYRGVCLSCRDCSYLVKYDCHRLLLKYACLAQCSAILSLPWDWQIWLPLSRKQSRVQSQLTSLPFIEREKCFLLSVSHWGCGVCLLCSITKWTDTLPSSPSGERTTGAWLALSCPSGGLMFCFVQCLSVSPTAHEREALSLRCWCELMEQIVGGP